MDIFIMQAKFMFFEILLLSSICYNCGWQRANKSLVPGLAPKMCHVVLQGNEPVQFPHYYWSPQIQLLDASQEGGF